MIHTVVLLSAAFCLGLGVAYFLYKLYLATLIPFVAIFVLLAAFAIAVQLALSLWVVNRGELIGWKQHDRS
jgi:hypothetical protein